MGIGATVIVMLVVSSVVAMGARRLRLPYTVALVVAGLGIRGAAELFPWAGLEELRLTPDLLFHLFLPALLFEAAFHLSWRKFRLNLKAILLLAVPGVVLAIAIAGFLAWLFEPWASVDLPLGVAFLLVAMLAATDPVSVIALFKELGVPKRLAVLMEGESLLNDAVGVVAFIAIAALLGLRDTGEAVTAGWVARLLLLEVLIGLGVGAALGLLMSWITSLVDDHLVEIMLTTIAAFGSYALAEALHGSFVLAVVAAGMATGNVGARYGMSPTNRIAVESFWEYVVFAANSFVFLLLGKEIDLARLVTRWLPILIAYLALTVARAAVVGVVKVVLRPTGERLPRRWAPVLIWGGLRGSLSMVLALSLPATFPQRELLIDLTFGVVLLSILLQGTTIGAVLRWAGLVGEPQERQEYMRLRGSLRATRAALQRLDALLSAGEVHEETYQTLREQLAARQLEVEEGLASLEPHLAGVRTDELRRTQERLWEVEREVIREAEKSGVVTDEVARELLRDVADRMARSEHEAPSEPPPAPPQAAKPVPRQALAATDEAGEPRQGPGPEPTTSPGDDES